MSDDHASTEDGRHPEQAFCLCGSAWFHAVISIEHSGAMNGYTGPLRCIECDAVMPIGWTGAVNPDGSYFDPGAEGSDA